MNFKLVSFLLSICLLFSFSYSLPNDFEKLELEILHDIEFELIEGRNSKFNYLNLYSYYVPQSIEGSQTLNSYSSSFDGEILFLESKDLLSMKYLFKKSNVENDVTYSTIFDVTTIPNYPKISSKQQFPYTPKDLNSYEKYLDFTEQIDLNDALKEKAFEIAGSEDDVYVIATNVANFVQEEIEYDLSTVFSNPDQKATEIFESKKGVCKELSIIYASMMRSLQIPTRMVVGYAYTNSEDIVDLVGSNWGGHAWVEVLIGDEWVPFDLTYQQYGFVDSSHIAFQHTPDISQLGVQLEMSAQDYEIKPNSLSSSFDFKVKEQENEFNPLHVNVVLISDYNEYTPNSYIKVSARIQNLENYYQVLPLKLISPNEVEHISSDSKVVILKPNEEKIVDFIVKMPNLEGYIFPFSLYTKNDELSQISFTLTKSGATVLQNEVFEKIQTTEVVEETYQNLELNMLESYTCEFVNSNNLKLKCGFILSESVSSVELCSSLDCSTYSGDSTYFEMYVPTSFNSKYTLQMDDMKIPLKLEFIVPKLEYGYTLDKEKIIFENLITEDLDYLIEFKSGVYSLELDSNDSIKELNLPPGEYTGIVYYYFLDELISTEVISFTIEKKTFLEMVSDFFNSFLS